MKVLGLAGSPRRGGNSETLLDRALAGAQDAGAEVEKVVVSRLKMRGCQHCDGCVETGLCIVQDDMQSVYPKLREMDAFVVASPMFFMAVTAQLKAVFDRCQCLWIAKYDLGQSFVPEGAPKRPGLFIALGGTRFKHLFDPSRVIVKSIFASLDVAYGPELFYRSIDKKGDIRQHPTALDEAYAAGRRLVTGE
ncbi:MAG: flavodoxin family protein [Chloroflexi bacterium]|nr:flavodoxin family protein [Chloroflexota bacterium]MBU1749924.1 flavodoxin family protein [Chloroflexota bacterium]